MSAKYHFKNSKDQYTRLLICPECGEQLVGADIEIYQACPYCDCKLERNCELEDFIIEPLVQRWVSRFSVPASSYGKSESQSSYF